MRQTVRIIDPNYSPNREKEFSEGGKRLLTVMKKHGIDREVRDEMRYYLATRESKSTAYRKTPSMHNELTRYGSPYVSSAYASDVLGVYNPDIIPVDTYIRMRSDPQVAIGLAVIKMPLYSLGWVVECEDIDIREFIKATLAPIWKKLLRSMLTAIDFGFASHEKVWQLVQMNVASTLPNGRKKTHYNGKAETYLKIKPHYPSTIKIRTDQTTDEFLGIIQATGGGGQSVSVDADKCFLFALNDEFGNFYGQSRLKPAYKSWYWKEVLTQFMLRYFERRGSPSSLVTHPTGISVDDQGNEYDNSTVALRIGQNIIENSVITLPYEPNKEGKNQWGVEFLQDEKRGEMFVNALNYLGAQILRGMLTPERVMTQDLSTGSYSMASSHADVFLLAQEGLAASMEDAINEHIIPPLVNYNFQPNKIIPTRIRIEKIQYDRKRILKEILIEIIRNMNTLIKAGSAPHLVPSIVEMGNVLGVPLRNFEEEYMKIESSEDDEVFDSDGNPIDIEEVVNKRNKGNTANIQKNDKIKKAPKGVPVKGKKKPVE